ncbi:MAG: 3' terminal RNA ribose 2'-O-methyltransferase Hen1 [Burkholderiales bacterium]|nr:3' terminal RNA ribose 2'-O-methyltransferase Hen1 [Burkholderiales bacterium]
MDRASDLGFLLHKHPDRVHRFDLSFGRATIFYPELDQARCTVCLLVEVDPVALVRKRSGPSGEGGQLAHYVNDRPYAVSSFFSVALAETFGTAMAGRSKDRPDLAGSIIPFEVSIPVLPSRGGEDLIRALFEPLGYAVDVRRLDLDQKFPEWGHSRYFDVKLAGRFPLQTLLEHLYVLIPVLDDEKHYWVGDDEVDKLIRRGGDWLPNHPARDQIARRYLKHRKSLTRLAIERLAGVDEDAAIENSAAVGKPMTREEDLEVGLSLNEQRLQRVVEAVQAVGAKSVVDLGCGEGKLLRELLKLRGLDRILGMEVSLRSLDAASGRLDLEQLSPSVRSRIELIHGSLMYRDRRLSGFDVATVIEVIEHLDVARLKSFERVLFECARPKSVVVTTPNVEYNVRFEGLPSGQFRHPDHRFEWSRGEFRRWGEVMASRFGYNVRFDAVGPVDSDLGAPTQMAVFVER